MRTTESSRQQTIRCPISRRGRAFEAFLTRHGCTVAPVTIDNDEFVYAAAYAAALRRGDRAAAGRIAADYLRYMDDVFSFFEDVSRRTIGREIAQVLSCTQTVSTTPAPPAWISAR